MQHVIRYIFQPCCSLALTVQPFQHASKRAHLSPTHARQALCSLVLTGHGDQSSPSSSLVVGGYDDPELFPTPCRYLTYPPARQVIKGLGVTPVENGNSLGLDGITSTFKPPREGENVVACDLQRSRGEDMVW